MRAIKSLPGSTLTIIALYNLAHEVVFLPNLSQVYIFVQNRSLNDLLDPTLLLLDAVDIRQIFLHLRGRPPTLVTLYSTFQAFLEDSDSWQGASGCDFDHLGLPESIL